MKIINVKDVIEKHEGYPSKVAEGIRIEIGKEVPYIATVYKHGERIESFVLTHIPPNEIAIVRAVFALLYNYEYSFKKCPMLKEVYKVVVNIKKIS